MFRRILALRALALLTLATVGVAAAGQGALHARVFAKQNKMNSHSTLAKDVHRLLSVLSVPSNGEPALS